MCGSEMGKQGVSERVTGSARVIVIFALALTRIYSEVRCGSGILLGCSV